MTAGTGVEQWWLDALGEPLSHGEWHAVLDGSEPPVSPTDIVLLAARARLWWRPCPRKVRQDTVEVVEGTLALHLPEPTSPHQLSDFVAAWNRYARARRIAQRLAYSLLQPGSRTLRQFLRTVAPATVGYRTGVGPDADTSQILADLMRAARFTRLDLWVIDHAERADAALRDLLAHWLIKRREPPYLLLEFHRRGRHLVLSNPFPLSEASPADG